MKKFASAALVIAPMMLLSGCSKPSQDEIHAKLVEDASALQLSGDDATAFADCAAPKLHEELSRSSLNTYLEDGMEAEVAQDDADKSNKILEDCYNEVAPAA
ncbi:hypothetical protein EK0264_11020 [Epidermidibacterium keratini]|uniref:Uncharacterized protein n=1 Tax=Epidermidibacterium keratini TaxID=1891644 RepID=A0A7L4YQE1_9ACTN|nr:hypothetical protein [Epidermidibacterium keratini]QHC00767.1 hypothetical protein EK0264_11020 [Epidermidibacterium keratini]